MNDETRPIHVAHVINGLAQGGAEALLVTYLRMLRRDDLRHSVYALFDFAVGGDFWVRPLTELAIPVVSLSARTPRGFPRASIELARRLRAERIDLVHAHLTYASLVSRFAGLAAHVPVVSSIHSVSYEPATLAEYRDPTSRKHDVARVLEGASSRWLDARVVAVGDVVAESAKRRMYLPAESLRTIHNPIDFATLDRPGASRDALLADAGIPRGARVAVMVGRVVATKNTAVAVRAVGRLRDVHPDLHAVVLGDCSSAAYVHEVREAITSSGLDGRVHLLGARRDVADWLRAADVFVFPSSYEGLPISLAEASALGVPCVASDIPGNREVIADGETGRLVPAGDVAALASAIDDTLSAPEEARRRAEVGRARTRERFDPARASAAMVALYAEILAERAPRRARALRSAS